MKQDKQKEHNIGSACSDDRMQSSRSVTSNQDIKKYLEIRGMQSG
jgi:hypothetical protein